MDVTMAKKCTKCGEIKPANTEFFGPSKVGRNGLNAWCRDCLNAYSREWTRNNRDKANAAARRYARSHPEKISELRKNHRLRHLDKEHADDQRYYQDNRQAKMEYARRYREAHKEQVRLCNRQWREANSEHVRTRSKEWRQENYQRYRDNIRLWQKANPEKKRRHFHVRRSRLKNLPCTLTPEEWRNTVLFFGHKCAYCGRALEEREIKRDHLVPVVRGGGYVYGNMVPCCISCNSSKNDSLLSDWYQRQTFFSAARLDRLIEFTSNTAQQDSLKPRQLSLFLPSDLERHSLYASDLPGAVNF